MTDVRRSARLTEAAQPQHMETIEEAGRTPARVRWSRLTFTALAWLLVAAVIVQIFLAGLAVFVDAGRWATHKSFVHTFEFVPLLMLALAFAGRQSRPIITMTVALFVAIMLQYVLADLRTSGIPELAALHVVNGAGIYYLTMNLARRATASVRRQPAGASS